MRLILLILTCLSAACSGADQHQSTPADSATGSRTGAAPSAIEATDARANGVTDSFSHQQTVAAAEIALWRGSAIPDHIDTLMAAALSTEGAFTGDDEMYDFSGSKRTFEELGNVSLAVPRLVDCLGWDQRAAATYRGARLLVGVICHQALIRNPTIRKLVRVRGPDGYPNVWVDYRNPAIAEVRKAQVEWRKLVLNQPL